MSQMERKSGFKECPRCGLRNKPIAAQCDFCGWEFQDSSEEWISHVQVLEKLNKQTESIMLDDEISKRIESTIVRSSRELRSTSPPPPIDFSRAEEPKPVDIELLAKGKDWASSRMQTPSMPAPESKEVKAFVDTMIGEPVKVDASADIEISDYGATGMANAPMSPVKDLGRAPARTFAFKAPPLTHVLIASGIGFYLVALMVFTLSPVPLLLAWTMAIVGSMLVTIGAFNAYDQSNFGKRRAAAAGASAPIEKEMLVLICPSCNEEVGSRDRNCPACGARFVR